MAALGRDEASVYYNYCFGRNNWHSLRRSLQTIVSTLRSLLFAFLTEESLQKPEDVSADNAKNYCMRFVHDRYNFDHFIRDVTALSELSLSTSMDRTRGPVL
jgi:hypothetical protein